MDVQNPKKIKKDKLLVEIYTRDYRISGEVHLIPGSRLTDFINTNLGESFIAVTNNQVFTLSDNKLILKPNYLAINRNAVTMVIPQAPS